MADLLNDIERYRRGEMSPAEMHRLEKQALKDPFLADALEGVESIEADNFSSDISELGRRISGRAKSSSWVTPLRIAASVILVMVASYVLYTFLTPASPALLSKLETKKDSPAPAEKRKPSDSAAKTVVPVQKNDNLLSLNKPAAKAKQPLDEPKPSASEIKGAPPVSLGEEAPAIPQKETREEIQPEAKTSNAAPESVAEAEMAEEIITAQDKALDSKKESFSLSRSSHAAGSGVLRKKDSSERLITGTVRDAGDNLPLPGVNVVIKGTTEGTVTDAKGNYQIPAADAKKALIFSSIGFESLEIPSDDQSEIDVTLQQNVNALSEVVVSGYGLAKDDDSDTNITVELAQPAGGQKEYNDYLEKNLLYPAEARANKVEGKVTVEFMVRKDGTLSDFKVIRGLAAGCNDEVIRLIKEGPAWTPNRKDKVARDSKVRVRVKFD
jgi:TonB family protein